MKIHSVNSIQKAIKQCAEIATHWGDKDGDKTTDVWFRGVNEPYDLLPSCYWKRIDEQDSLVVFKQLVRNAVNTREFDPWDDYCLARHHGIPTRLLDWSEGIFQALFFAFDGWDASTKPCIWIMRPDILNEISVQERDIFAPGGEFTNLWLPPIEQKTKQVPGESREWNNRHPLAIYPARSNDRVISQLGTFTVHGVDNSPLNTWLESTGRIDECLQRVDINVTDRDLIRRQLFYLGIRQSAIYPGPDSIAKDIGYMYGWEDKPLAVRKRTAKKKK